MAITRGVGMAGKHRATAPMGNSHEHEPLTQSGSRQKRGGAKPRLYRSAPKGRGMTTHATIRSGRRQEWETGRRALVGAKPRDQPPKGAKRARSTRGEERSTANGGAYEHMNRLSQKAMIGARARAYATRKQGREKIKAVARRGRAKPAPEGQGLSAPRRWSA